MVSSAESPRVSAGFSVLIQSLGVLLSAALVVTNKGVLSLFTVPGKSAFLTFVHYGITFSWIRGHAFCREVPLRKVPVKWILLITTLGTCSVLMSNLVLELSSITFHQISKLAALPCGALVDYWALKKVRTWPEFALLSIICFAVYLTAVGNNNLDFSFGASCAALIYVGTYVSVAALLRHVCQRYELSTSDFMYLSTPYGLLASFCFLIIVLFYESSAADASGAAFQAPHSFVLESVPMVCLNMVLAVSVQWLSTWTAGNSSAMLYAVIGQAKTAATVALGVLVFQTPLPIKTIVGLSICLVSAFALALSEASECKRVTGHSSLFTNKTVVLSSAIFLSTLLLGVFWGTELLPSESHSKHPWLKAGQTRMNNPTEVLSAKSSVSSSARALELHFRVITVTKTSSEALSCGGCNMLWQLAEEIQALGFPVMMLYTADLEQTNWDCKVSHENTIVVFPEGYARSCLQPPRITVRWLLAPIGSIFGFDVAQEWSDYDWTYSYGTLGAKTAWNKIPDSNLLVVLRNPYPGDTFDPSMHSFTGERKGTCYTVRKQSRFHPSDSVVLMHDSSSEPIPETVEDAVKMFLSHEYFVSYDPYTYLTFISSWLGCIPIVHPLKNMTKKEWLMSTAWGPYIRGSKRDIVSDGVAYGNSQDEIDTARKTLPLMREEFFRVKTWGRSTLNRFIDDVVVNVTGTGNYKGRLLVKDLFPKGWTPLV